MIQNLTFNSRNFHLLLKVCSVEVQFIQSSFFFSMKSPLNHFSWIVDAKSKIKRLLFSWDIFALCVNDNRSRGFRKMGLSPNGDNLSKYLVYIEVSTFIIFWRNIEIILFYIFLKLFLRTAVVTFIFLSLNILMTKKLTFQILNEVH